MRIMTRLFYAAIVFLLWCLATKNGCNECGVTNDMQYIGLAIVVAGALAGGD